MSAHTTEPVVPESAWFKSSYSSGGGGECVEVAATVAGVFVRDSKQASGPVLTVGPGAWAGFVGLVTG
ncbi:DUF397 domain-containing protein [Streptomyces sp. NPDC004735]|uniref:DUF397 domain-containing protein n=1 Tax=Streptomyces sp. NPDC004735 TaxID=3156654 RepID=UPI0033BC3D45